MEKNNAYSGLNAVHMDVLQEIGNIGAGNAATSLAVMLDAPVDISLPKVNLVGFNEVANEMGGAESVGYGILVTLAGDVDGMMMFILDKRFAHQVLNVLMGGMFEDFSELDEIALSAIKEVGNILSAAYVNAIAELTGLRIELSVPYAAADMIGALLSVPITKFGAIGDKVLFIEEAFNSKKETVSSHMILFAEIDSLNLILGKLGLM